MADDTFLFRTDARTVKRLFDAVRRSEKAHRNDPSRQLDGVFASDESIRFLNKAQETIPAGGCVRISGAELVAGRPYLTVVKPDGLGRPSDHLINGDRDVAAEEVGAAFRSYPAIALYDPSEESHDLLPDFVDDWGPKGGSWYLHRGRLGFRRLGDAADDRLWVWQPEIGKEWRLWKNDDLGSSEAETTCPPYGVIAMVGAQIVDGQEVIIGRRGFRNEYQNGFDPDFHLTDSLDAQPYHAFNSSGPVKQGEYGYLTQTAPFRAAFRSNADTPSICNTWSAKGGWYLWPHVGNGLFVDEQTAWMSIGAADVIREFPDVEGTGLFAGSMFSFINSTYCPFGQPPVS